MSLRKLDEVHSGILALCIAPTSLRSLEGRLATHAALYRHARDLVEAGFLRKLRRGLWQTTPSGKKTLEEAQSLGSRLNPLDILYPPLRLLPPVHRALAHLLILAAYARKHKLREDHHPFGLIYGETMTFKTLLAWFIAYALGEDPSKSVIMTPTESGRSMAFRKTYGGKLASIRAALGQLFVCLDEYHRADRMMKRVVSPYLMGTLKVPVENDVLDVRPVTLVAMNPLKGRTVSEQTGFDTAELRRAMPCRVTAADVPEHAKLHGDELVNAARKAGPLAMPAPTGTVIRAEDVVGILRPNLTREADGVVDFETIAMLAEAMAVFTDEDPIGFALHDILTCYETVGFADSAWRTRLAAVRGGTDLMQSQTPRVSRDMSLREQTLIVLEREGQVLERGLDHHERLTELDVLLRERGLDVNATLRQVRGLLKWDEAGYPFPVLEALYPVWRKTGDPERFSIEVEAIVERFGTFEKWEETLAEQEKFLARNGGSWGDVHEALLQRQELEPYGLSPKDGRLLLRRLAEEAVRRTLDPHGAVCHVFDLVRAHDDLYAATEDHKKSLSEETRRLQESREKRAAQEKAWAEQHTADVQARAQERIRWEEGRAAHEAKMAKGEQRLQALADEIIRNEARVAETEKQVLQAQARFEEQSGRVSRLDASFVVGEAILRAVRERKVKGLVVSAQIVVETMKNLGSIPIPTALRDLEDYENCLNQFVEHLGKPCIPLDDHRRELAEKDRMITELKARSSSEETGNKEVAAQ